MKKITFTRQELYDLVWSTDVPSQRLMRSVFPISSPDPTTYFNKSFDNTGSIHYLIAVENISNLRNVEV